MSKKNDKNSKMALTIRIPTALNKKLDKHVAVMGLTKSAFLLSLINQAVSRVDSKKEQEQ